MKLSCIVFICFCGSYALADREDIYQLGQITILPKIKHLIKNKNRVHIKDKHSGIIDTSETKEVGVGDSVYFDSELVLINELSKHAHKKWLGLTKKEVDDSRKSKALKEELQKEFCREKYKPLQISEIQYKNKDKPATHIAGEYLTYLENSRSVLKLSGANKISVSLLFLENLGELQDSKYLQSSKYISSGFTIECAKN